MVHLHKEFSEKPPPGRGGGGGGPEPNRGGGGGAPGTPGKSGGGGGAPGISPNSGGGGGASGTPLGGGWGCITPGVFVDWRSEGCGLVTGGGVDGGSANNSLMCTCACVQRMKICNHILHIIICMYTLATL